MKKILVFILMVTMALFAMSSCEIDLFGGEEDSYTVTFDSDGGTAVDSQTVTSGEKATAPTAPTKEGYTFAGWYNGETAYDFETEVTEDVTLKAKWTVVTYTVTFDADNGTAATTQTVAYGKTATAPAAPAKEGFTFAGWYVGETAYDFTAAVKSDVTLKAKWTQNTYTVTFDADNGSENTTATVNHGATVSAPTAPTKEGFEFAGWYAGETAYDFTAAVKSNVALKAKWTQITYTVTFNADNGSENITVTVNYGATAEAPSDPTKVGFEFAGWFAEGADVAYDFTTAVKSDVTLTAKWATVVCEVVIDAANGSEATTQKVVYGEAAIKPEATPEKTGFKFLGWFVGDDKYDFAAPVTTDIKIVAKWEVITYTVTIDAANGSEATTETVNHGATATKPEATPEKTGFEFLGWFVGDDEYDFATPVTSDIKVVAKWKEIIPDLTAIAGKWTGEDENNYYSFVINVDGTITASYENSFTEVVMNKNYVLFDGENFVFNYSTATSPTPQSLTFVFSKENHTLKTEKGVAGTAFTLTKMLTVTFDYNYDGATAPKLKQVEYNNTISAETKTRTGYTLDGWFLEGSETAFDFTTPITENITLYAKWSVKMITVTFVGQDGTTVVDTTKVVYNTPYGEIAAPTTIPTTDGYKFNGLWYSSITGTSPVSATAKLTSDKTYYPGLIAPMTDIAGTWIGANSKGVSYTMVVNAADQTVAITTVNGETTEELDIKSILFKLFATSTPTTKLVVRYLPAGESEKMLTLTYKDNGTFTGDNSLVLEKQGVTKYDVTFNSDGGSEVATQSIEDGAVATEPTAPTKDGFDFVGWFLEGSEVAYDFATPVTSAITLTAKWTEKKVTYTVTFDTGNAATTTTQNVVEGECVVAPANPSKSGYTFMGWYNGDVKFDLTTPITTNLVLTSKFGYAVTFYNQAKEIVKEMVLESGSVIPESEIPEPSINDGYIFAGTWHKSYTVSAAPVDLTAPITGATKLYPGVIKESIATELAGTWTGEKDGKTYTFKIEVSKDTENKVTAVTVTVISCGDIEIDYEKIFSYQYNTSSTYTQLCIKYFKKNSTSTSPSSFAINYYSDGTVKLGSPAIILTKVVEETPEA